MGFEQEYLRYMDVHRRDSSGERRKRLAEGVGHGEKLFLEAIWWAGFGNFNYLFPEYEVSDEKGKSRFIDFAYTFSWFKIAFEVQGFGPHLKQMSRWSYSDEQQRIRSLSAAGWTLMYFSYDEIKDSPEQCIKDIQSLLGGLLGRETGDSSLSMVDKEIIGYAIANNGVIYTKKLYRALQLHRNTVYKYLRGLVDKKWLEPAGSTHHHQYHLNMQKKHLFR